MTTTASGYGRYRPFIEVDFNGIGWERPGHVLALVDPLVLERGQEVIARDEDGNRCDGVVTEVRGRAVEVKLDLDTWINGSASSSEKEAL
jgi:hypothetical protein